MNLNFSNFQMLLESFLEEDSCLSTGSDDILFLKSKSPVLFGTLPESAKNTKKYLQLDAGDIVLLNDPYSGGGPTNEFTFIVITQAFAVPLYYSVKKIFGPLKTPADHIEKEGLRITPTPIKQKGEINISILDAIEVFPNTPVGFKNWILQELKQLSDWAQRFENAIGHCKTRSSKTFIKDFLEFSKSKTEVLLQNYSSFETKHEIKTTNNETLKLELHLKENRFNFEWSASSHFMGLNLTESHILGICTEVILRTFKIPYRNSGCFSCIRVVKPHSSFLNTKYPAPMMRGNQEGLDLIQTVVEAALSQLPKNQFPLSLGSPSVFLHLSNRTTQWDIQFAGDPHPLPLMDPQLSIENLEKKLPLFFEHLNFRVQPSSHQTLEHGMGLSLKLKFLKEMTLSMNTLGLPYENYYSKSRATLTPALIQWNEQEIKNPSEDLLRKEVKAGEILFIQTSIGKS